MAETVITFPSSVIEKTSYYVILCPNVTYAIKMNIINKLFITKHTGNSGETALLWNIHEEARGGGGTLQHTN